MSAARGSWAMPATADNRMAQAEPAATQRERDRRIGDLGESRGTAKRRVPESSRRGLDYAREARDSQAKIAPGTGRPPAFFFQGFPQFRQKAARRFDCAARA